MKTVKFSDQSWHCRFARFADDCDERDLSTICGYTWAVFAGFVWFCLFTAIGGMLLISFIDVLVWIGSGLFYKFTYLGFLAIPAVVFSIFFTIGMMCLAWNEFAIRRIYKNQGHAFKKANFITEAYDAFKNKWCFKVEIEHTKKADE